MSSQEHQQSSYFQFFPQQGVGKAKNQGRCLLPSQPQLPESNAGPKGSPSAPQAQTHIPGGDEGGTQPQLQERGRGAERLCMAAPLAQPARPQPLGKVLLPPAGCCSPTKTGRGVKARQGWAQQSQQPGPGAGRYCPPGWTVPTVQAGSSRRRSGRKGQGIIAQGFWLAFRLCCNLCYFQRARGR